MMKKKDIKKNFDYENAYMLSAPVERIGKLITRFELFSKIKNIPGEIIECGVVIVEHGRQPTDPVESSVAAASVACSMGTLRPRFTIQLRRSMG